MSFSLLSLLLFNFITPVCFFSQVQMGVEVTFDLLGVLYNQLQSCHAEDIKEDYDTGKDGTAMVSFKVEFDLVDKLEDAIKSNCRRDLVFYKT
jgi:hypothetical protein